MTPNGPGIIQGMPPDADVEAIAEEVEIAVLKIFNKYSFDYYQSKYVLEKMVNLEKLKNNIGEV